MEGYCKDCKKEENCKKDIGFIWGFCYADFEPKEKDNEKTRVEVRYES